MSIQGNVRAQAIAPVGAGGSGAGVGATTSLLPTPPASQVGTEEAVTMLLKMSSQMSEQQLRIGKAGVDVADKRREDATVKRKEALDRAVEAAKKAREAAEDDGGFFSFVTDNIGAVGLVGLCTFNWGLVAADITAHQTDLSNGSTNALDLGAAVFGGPLAYLAEQGAKSLAPDAMSQTGVAAALIGGPLGYALERAAAKLSPTDYAKLIDEKTSVKDEDVRLANKIALMVALAAVAATSVVLSGGTSTPAVVALVGIGISTGTQIASETGLLKEVVGEKAAVYVALGGAITGAALTLGGSIASLASASSAAANVASMADKSKTLSNDAQRILSAANGARAILGGAHDIKQGVDALERADYQHEADLANVDAEEQRHVLARIEKIVDAILEDLKEARDSAERSTQSLQESLQIKNQTLLQAGTMKV